MTRNRQENNAANQFFSSLLVASLRDSDFETRYYAVVGLAEITRQKDWRPLMDQFKANQGRYLTYWTNWARANK
jgi:hypothetical protein